MARFKISLKEVNNARVSLAGMTPEALNSFLQVVYAFQEIVVELSTDDSISFSIVEGSARCEMIAPDQPVMTVRREIDSAIQGRSRNKVVTKHLRTIQSHVKNDAFVYDFTLSEGSTVISNYHQQLIDARKISIPKNRNQYNVKIDVISGFLNQIGGNDPNYHFDRGSGDKLTIACTRAEAQSVNQYLYRRIQSLVYVKIWHDDEKRDEYTHISVLDGREEVRIFKDFFSEYYRMISEVDRLDSIYMLIERPMAIELKVRILNHLLKSFTSDRATISEIKTLLIASRAFSEYENLSSLRELLAEKYNNIVR